ncbi:hypothetical protein [Haloferax sp. Atlit-4N]|nr:hypothetical protein [Haloferax sp. Atlit-4N]
MVEDVENDEEIEEQEREQSAHLIDIEDGAGCTEIWDHLSEKRES